MKHLIDIVAVAQVALACVVIVAAVRYIAGVLQVK
jgi:hypothetical protein